LVCTSREADGTEPMSTMSNSKRTRDEVELADLSRPRFKRPAAEAPRGAGKPSESDGRPQPDVEAHVAGDVLRVDDVFAIIQRSLDYEVAEWLARHAATPSLDVIH